MSKRRQFIIKSLTIACLCVLSSVQQMAFGQGTPMDKWLDPDQRALINQKQQEDKAERQLNDKKGQVRDDEGLALGAAALKDYESAVRLMKKAIGEAEGCYGKSSFWVAELWFRLGRVYREWQHFDDADHCYKYSMVVYNSLDSGDREQIWAPADDLSDMIEGSDVLNDAEYSSWVRSAYGSAKARQAMVDRLDYIRNHTDEKFTLDNSWGVLAKQQDPSMETFYVALQSKLRSVWQAAGQPERPAQIMLTVDPRYNTDGCVYESSRSKSFDEAALQACRKAIPYPQLPHNLLRLTVEIDFDRSGPSTPHKRENY